MFATQTNKAKTAAEKKPQRADAGSGKDSAEPNPVWQSLALSPLSIQAKVAISQPGDPYEQEADQVADRVTRSAAPRLSDARLSFPSLNAQRRCAHCDERDERNLQHNQHGASADSSTGPPVVHEALSSPGQPLNADIRAFVEPRLGHDFGHVRVHTNNGAAESARAANSLAYTSGSDIVFGAGRYAPSTHDGQLLLAHELAHVVQQSSGVVSPGVSRPGDVHERGADEVAARVVAGGDARTLLPPKSSTDRSAAAAVQRQYSSSAAPTSDPNALIPIADFITYVGAVERTYSSDTPQQILTRIRQQYYSGTGFDELIPDAPRQETIREALIISGPGGMPAGPFCYVPPETQRRKMGPSIGAPAYSHLTAHADENAIGDNPSPYIVMPDGSRIDIGHLLLGLDSLLHPRVTEPFAAYGISGNDAAGFAADLALASYWTTYHSREGSPADNAAVRPATADFNAYYTASAPNEDLLSDADAFGTSQQWTSAPGQQLSQVLQSYYLGSSGAAPGVDRRWRAFCAANGLGYTVADGTVTWWVSAIETVWVPRINRLCDLFDAGFFSKGFSVAFGTAPSLGTWPYTLPALLRFLLWLKPRLEAEIRTHP